MDSGFLGAGIGALEECTRTCVRERQPVIQYWIGRAYLLLNMPLKTYRYWIQIENLGARKMKQVAAFLDEYVFFTRISDLAEAEVSKFMMSKSKPDKNTVLMIAQSLKQIEKLDRPNCMLYNCRVQSYLSGAPDSSLFDQLITSLPSFIDGYIEFWKFLRYLKTDNLAKMRTIAETAMYFSDCS